MPLKWLEIALKVAGNGLKMAGNGVKMAGNALKMAGNAPKMAENSPKMAGNGPKMSSLHGSAQLDALQRALRWKESLFGDGSAVH